MTQPTKPQSEEQPKQEKNRQRLRNKALAYLARREHSQQELQQKLRAYLPPIEENVKVDLETHHQMVDEVIADFKQRGWLSELRFTEQVVHARKQKFGSMRIAHELREKGITEEVVEVAIAEVKADEFTNACNIWRKKYKVAPQNREEWAKQARFLQSRGFGFDMIKKVLNQNFEE
jgi:regulatory protein